MRLTELDARLADPQIGADIKRYRALAREQAEASSLVALFQRYQVRERDLATAREMLLDDSDAAMTAMAREEAVAAEADLHRLHAELQTALLPRDPDDARNAFIEIRAGTGGDESALFAGDLARMYLRWCERQGLATEIISESASELGGYKEVVIRVAGEQVYGRLRFESGGHRVQRVPATESQGRIHTSACTVAVMPEADEADEVQLNPADLRIDTFRASGAGGQHVNKTDSAIRITHLPTGIGGRVPGRPLPAPQQGQGDGGAGRSLRDKERLASGRRWRPQRERAWSEAVTAATASAPTTSRKDA